MDTVKGALSALNTESETGEPEKWKLDEMILNRGRQVWRRCQIPGRRDQQHQEVWPLDRQVRIKFKNLLYRTSGQRRRWRLVWRMLEALRRERNRLRRYGITTHHISRRPCKTLHTGEALEGRVWGNQDSSGQWQCLRPEDDHSRRGEWYRSSFPTKPSLFSRRTRCMLPTSRGGKQWTKPSRNGSQRWRHLSKCGKTKQVTTCDLLHLSHRVFLQLPRIRSPTPSPTLPPATWNWKILRLIWIPWRRCSSRNRKWWMVWTRPQKRNCQTKVLFTLSCIKPNWTKWMYTKVSTDENNHWWKSNHPIWAEIEM